MLIKSECNKVTTKRKVFIVTYNGYHQLIAQAILELEGISDDSIILDHHLISSEKLKKYKNYIALDKNEFKKFFQVAKWRFIINKFIKKYGIEEVIIPHSEGVISNLLYSSYKNKYKLSFFHEGILSFYDFKREGRSWFRFRKDIFPLLFLYKFKRYDNLFDINNENTFKFYTPIISKELVVNDLEKIEKIELSNFSFSGLQEFDVLILGTPFPKSTSTDIEILYERIKRILEEHNVKKVAYKPHPVEGVLLSRIISQAYETTILERRIPIEEFVSRINPRFVISFNSSALISLKTNNLEKDFYCLFFEKQYKVGIYNLFHDLGIICLVE